MPLHRVGPELGDQTTSGALALGAVAVVVAGRLLGLVALCRVRVGVAVVVVALHLVIRAAQEVPGLLEARLLLIVFL